MNVSGLTHLYQDVLVQGTPSVKQTNESGTFRDMLMEEIQNVSRLEKESDSITNDFITGETDSIHSVLIAAEKASISLEMIVEVRDKVLEAYNEVMRMQV